MGAVPTPELPPGVEVRRSRRRNRTVTAYREGDRTVVMIPARFTRAQEREWVDRMIARLSAQERRRRPPDADLLERARDLSGRHLGGLARPASVTWVANQNARWGSCTPVDRTIRLSTRLQGMPSWVIDYVLVHELAHLLEQGHGARFWALVESYPRAERARGYLEGFTAARDHRIGDDPTVDLVAQDDVDNPRGRDHDDLDDQHDLGDLDDLDDDRSDLDEDDLDDLDEDDLDDVDEDDVDGGRRDEGQGLGVAGG